MKSPVCSGAFISCWTNTPPVYNRHEPYGSTQYGKSADWRSETCLPRDSDCERALALSALMHVRQGRSMRGFNQTLFCLLKPLFRRLALLKFYMKALP